MSHEEQSIVKHPLMSQISQDDATSTFRYAIFVELDWRTMENFLSFIQYQGNEDEICQLEKIIDMTDNDHIPEKCSVFYIETCVLVSEITAREMAETYISHRHLPKKLNGKFNMPNININCLLYTSDAADE